MWVRRGARRACCPEPSHAPISPDSYVEALVPGTAAGVFGDGASKEVISEREGIRAALCQSDCVEGRNADTTAEIAGVQVRAQSGHHERAQGEEGRLPAAERGHGRPGPAHAWTSDLQPPDGTRISFCSLSRPDCWALPDDSCGAGAWAPEQAPRGGCGQSRKIMAASRASGAESEDGFPVRGLNFCLIINGQRNI